MSSVENAAVNAIKKIGGGKRILFASVPADGHVNPLTSLAVHLKKSGYDVCWYTSKLYEDKINNLQIPFYPFEKALDVRGDNVEEIFPERSSYKSQVAKLNFDIIHFFVGRATEYYEDILNIYKTFPFDLMIADCAFTAIPFVKEKMKIPAIAIGVLPLTETSKDLPPAGLGLTPTYSFFGGIKEAALRFIAKNILFKKSSKVLAKLCADNRLPYNGESIFDYIIKHSTLLLQSGTPGFEYHRSDMGKNIRFIGPLLPHTKAKQSSQWFDERLNKYEKVILVTQGTVEKDIDKLLVPTLEAFKESDVLVIATTGGSQTQALRKKFSYSNIIIEDFIPFSDVMPYTDVYVTNGGYGGVLLAIENEVPLVAAGVHEGKNEISARIGYFGLGVNLKTERPQPAQVKRAVEEALYNPAYKLSVSCLAVEFSKYIPTQECEKWVRQLLNIEEAEEVIY
jgi:MGT family glycosyltransferase